MEDQNLMPGNGRNSDRAGEHWSGESDFTQNSQKHDQPQKVAVDCWRL